jgi:hypothetical protein
MAPHDADRPSAAWWWLAFGGVLVCCLASIAASESLLPARVVTKWANGRATNFMSRDEWIISGMVLVAAPALLVAVIGTLTARFLPRCWSLELARATGVTRARIIGHADRLSAVLGGGAALWMSAFHYLIIRANRSVPPRLDMWPIAAWVGVFVLFVAGTVGWTLRGIARR